MTLLRRLVCRVFGHRPEMLRVTGTDQFNEPVEEFVHICRRCKLPVGIPSIRLKVYP